MSSRRGFGCPYLVLRQRADLRRNPVALSRSRTPFGTTATNSNSVAHAGEATLLLQQARRKSKVWAKPILERYAYRGQAAAHIRGPQPAAARPPLQDTVAHGLSDEVLCPFVGRLPVWWLLPAEITSSYLPAGDYCPWSANNGRAWLAIRLSPTGQGLQSIFPQSIWRSTRFVQEHQCVP